MANLHGKNLPGIAGPFVRQPEYFGGVKNDVRWMELNHRPFAPGGIPGRTLLAIDAALSLPLDVMTFPVVAWQRHTGKYWPFDQKINDPLLADYRRRSGLSDETDNRTGHYGLRSSSVQYNGSDEQNGAQLDRE